VRKHVKIKKKNYVKEKIKQETKDTVKLEKRIEKLEEMGWLVHIYNFLKKIGVIKG